MMHFVYVIQSEVDGQSYVGSTKNVDLRIKEHNKGRVDATANRCPFKLIAYFAFEKIEAALRFEKYLKTGTGRAFLSKHVF